MPASPAPETSGTNGDAAPAPPGPGSRRRSRLALAVRLPVLLLLLSLALAIAVLGSETGSRWVILGVVGRLDPDAPPPQVEGRVLGDLVVRDLVLGRPSALRVGW